MATKAEYVELGLTCADVGEALNRGMNGNQAEQLRPSVLGAIKRSTQ